MGLANLIELSPVLFSLPTLLVSLTFSSYSYNPWYGRDDEQPSSITQNAIPVTQSVLFAALTLLIVAFVCKLGYLNRSPLVYAAADDDNDTMDEKPRSSKLSFVSDIINTTVTLLFPLSCLLLANNLLLPIRIASLVVIEILIGRDSKKLSKHRSLQLEQEYSMDGTIVSVIFKKYQPIVIYLLCFLYDFVLHGRNTGAKKYIVLGYCLLLVPLLVFLNPFGSEFISKRAVTPKLNTSLVLSAGSMLLMTVYNLKDLNLKMIFVAIGSLIIFIVSQMDWKSVEFGGKPRSLFNRHMFTDNYKLNLLTLNFIMAAVQLISLNMGGHYSLNDVTATNDIVKGCLIDFALNVALVFLIQPESKTLSLEDADGSEKQQIPKDKETFISLIVQMVKYEESRSIFNFLLLNLSFMFVQILYSFRSRSLSLLSDSLHMFLDCTSLFLGMLASVIAKNNLEHPNKSYPFGLARVETLAGFANGSLLLGIVLGIFNQAAQRIVSPVPLERTTELLVVSILGLAVNLVGIFAFNHGGDGHSHGHSHTHGHQHNEESQQHTNLHSHTHQLEAAAESANYRNDNMHGIFLHIMADTLGSVGVVISTVMVKHFAWSIIDPLTSIFIGLLILLSSFPLLKSSSSNLLLSLEDGSAQQLKETLGQIRHISGVKSYTTPRFWPQNDSSSKLVGYLHVQYYRTENASNIRQKIDRILELSPVVNRCYIQLENEIDDCWCRKKAIFSTS
ncbi:hypothetical protein FOA43_004698 [Brettanomyces nanus]|uniref:Zinc transporter n=1 Tax=Eeniella nana TaxID=13502 RepID=A0A875RQK6_EENNA|nr:uncharacterized protein FOA43_004698 [Brettanomyces nanus]QPG77290.1 hypothetical protein FOA43_004698 [Brettanomyces nanus]